MKEWCKFSVCFWHTFVGGGSDMFGHPTFNRPWSTSPATLEEAKVRVDAAFELFSILGNEYFTFHDIDVIPV